jgi:hypothetical protein
MASGVRFSMINQTSTTGNMPTTAAVTYTQGVNAPGGPVEYFMLHNNLTFGGDPCSADFGNLISTLRIILNGEVVFDFRAGYAANDNDGPSIFNAFLNSIGGRAYEDPSGTTTRDYWAAIPLGRQTPAGVNRYEVVIGYAATAAGATITSGTTEFWLQMNPAMQKTTTVCPSTSFTHSASIEQVIVKVPQNAPSGSVVSAILVQNDSAADEFGTQGIRINALSDFGMQQGMSRFLNGDWANGIKYADAGTSTASQLFSYQVKGMLVLPSYGLTGGDVVLQVDSNAATTRTYTPILTTSVGAKSAPETRQTQSAPGNTAQSILSRTLE